MSVISKHAWLAGAFTAVVLAGCGTASMPSGHAPGGTNAPHQREGRAAKASLMVTLLAHPGAMPIRQTLFCDPPGGTMPHPAYACTTLLRTKPFQPRSIRIACPMIMASAGRITVTGTWYGRAVHRILVDGGCDLDQYGTFSKLMR